MHLSMRRHQPPAVPSRIGILAYQTLPSCRRAFALAPIDVRLRQARVLTRRRKSEHNAHKRDAECRLPPNLTGDERRLRYDECIDSTWISSRDEFRRLDAIDDPALAADLLSIHTIGAICHERSKQRWPIPAPVQAAATPRSFETRLAEQDVGTRAD